MYIWSTTPGKEWTLFLESTYSEGKSLKGQMLTNKDEKKINMNTNCKYLAASTPADEHKSKAVFTGWQMDDVWGAVFQTSPQCSQTTSLGHPDKCHASARARCHPRWPRGWEGIKGRLFSCRWWLPSLPQKTAKQDLPFQRIDIKHKSTILHPGSTFRKIEIADRNAAHDSFRRVDLHQPWEDRSKKIKSPRLRGSGGCKFRGNFDNWYSLITSWGRYQTPTHFTIPKFRK